MQRTDKITRVLDYGDISPAPKPAEGYRRMESMTLQEVIKATRGRMLAPDLQLDASRLRISGISIDSRSTIRGELFFALRGKRFDGHRFVAQALRKGALAAVVSHSWLENQNFQEKHPAAIIGVPEPLKSLQNLASHYRRKFDVNLIGVTGTNGKTTTKDMVAAVLSPDFQTLKTEGNFNNHIGVPLTLFRLSRQHQMAVVEMGMSGLGEIRRSAEISLPRHGLITNIGPAHLLQLKNLEAITKAKLELLGMLPSEGLAFLNADDHRLTAQRVVPRSRVVSFGRSSEARYRLADLRLLGGEGTEFQVAGIGAFQIFTLGQHNVYNALAAIAVGRELGISVPTIREALKGFTAGSMRMEPLRIGGAVILNDAYNANPASMRAALEVLAEIETGARRIAVLGDMLELGPEESAAHLELGILVAESDVDILITVGELARHIAHGALQKGFAPDRILQCADVGQVAERLQALIQPGDVVLLKASRGVHLEDILPVLTSSSEKG